MKKSTRSLYISSTIVLALVFLLSIFLLINPQRTIAISIPEAMQIPQVRNYQKLLQQEKQDMQYKALQNMRIRKALSSYIYSESDIIAHSSVQAVETRLEAIRQEEERKAQAEAERLAAEQAALQQQQNTQQQYYEDTSYQEPVYTPSYGDTGRLEIPALGISVALNAYGDSQAICDAWDSAWICESSSTLIADHSNQSFASLYGSYIGCGGTIYYSNGAVRNITCIAVTNGTNTGDNILVDGVPWYDCYAGCVIMYTCTYDWQHIYVSIWQ